MKKSLLKSKTFWTNVVMALLPLFPSIEQYVSMNPQMVIFAFAAINGLLRLITKKEVVLLP